MFGLESLKILTQVGLKAEGDSCGSKKAKFKSVAATWVSAYSAQLS